MTDLTQLTLFDMHSGLASKKFSSVELTEACLRKIEGDTALNAFIEVTRDIAIDQARDADQRIFAGESQPLLGVPVALKDIILQKGVKNTCGSRMLANFVSPYDATVTERLRSAGAVLVGKTNMDEFAMGSSNETSAFGSVQNPWNREFVPGGSSGGSASAVAARLVPAALGTDTGGSIRQPASFTNTVGIKPTYGRVSRYGVVAFASSLDQVGTFARTVRDAAIVTKVIAGHDPKDSTSSPLPVPDFSAALCTSIKGLRLGVPKEYFIDGMSPEVSAAIKEALATLVSLGAEIVEISLPHTEAGVAAYYIVAPAEASSNLARFDGIRYGYRAKDAKGLTDLYCKTRAEGFGNEVKRRIMIGSYVLSSGYFDAYYLRAQKVRTLIKQDFTQAFSKHCDVIVCPTAPTPPFRIGDKVSDPLSMYLNDVFTIPVNLAGLPGMSIPCGFSANHLPIGLQLIGKPFDEESLFKVGAAYEGATKWTTHAPKA